MKLIRCHIDHFGCLSDYDKEFTDGLNVMELGNGWGKSTLCAFLRVMFYGFESDGKKRELDRERTRFLPWQGGQYGGSLTFEAAGRRYRIERVFSARRAGDRFGLYDDITGLPCADYSENIGRELFGIDQTSFLHTVCQEQLHVRTDVTPQITAKIGSVEGDETDMRRYGEAQDRLKELALSITPQRRTGEIYRLRTEEAALRARAAGREAGEAEMASLLRGEEEAASRLEELAAEEKALKDEQAAVSAWQEKRAGREKLESLTAECRAAVEKRDAARAAFPREVPDQEVLSSVWGAASSQDAVEAEVRAYSLSPEETAVLEAGRERLASVPADVDPASLADTAAEAAASREAWQKLCLTPDEEKMLRAETRLFAQGVPDAEELGILASRWEHAGAEKARAEERAGREEELKAQRVKLEETRNWYAFAAMISLLAALAGAAVWYLKIWPAGIGLAAAGLVIAAVFFFAGRKASSERAVAVENLKAREAENTREKEEALETIRQLEEDTRAVYGRIDGLEYREENMIANLYKLRDYAEEYVRLGEKRDAAEASAEKSDCLRLENDLRERMGAYGKREDNDYARGLAEWQDDLAENGRFEERLVNERLARDKYEKQEGMIDRFLERYGFAREGDPAEQLTRIRMMAGDLTSRQAELKEREENLAAFSRGVDVEELRSLPAEPPGRSLTDIGERQEVVRAEERSLRKESAARSRRIDAAEERLEEMAADAEKAEELSERIRTLSARYEILTETAARLEEAKTRFSNRYAEPIRQAFEEYYRMIAPDDDKRYRLDANLEVSLEQGGVTRDIGYLSEGFQDLLGLCRRLAMTDSMYRRERPFLILDDPLVNLDDEKMQGGFAFLREVAGRCQVLYFTCHTSRVP